MIGYFDTQEEAAHAFNAAIRRAGLDGRRKTNPVVDGQLVPKKRKARGHGPPRKSRKRRSEEPAAATSARRRATPAVGDRVTLTLDDADDPYR